MKLSCYLVLNISRFFFTFKVDKICLRGVTMRWYALQVCPDIHLIVIRLRFLFFQLKNKTDGLAANADALSRPRGE